MDANLLPVHHAESQATGAFMLLHKLSGHLDREQYAMAKAEADRLQGEADELRRRYEQGVTYATLAQKQDIQRLLNHPAIEKAEKTAGLLELPRMTSVTASAVIIGLKLDINAREGNVVYPEVLGYTVVAGEVVEAKYEVVGSAEVVSVQQQAA